MKKLLLSIWIGLLSINQVSYATQQKVNNHIIKGRSSAGKNTNTKIMRAPSKPVATPARPPLNPSPPPPPLPPSNP